MESPTTAKGEYCIIVAQTVSPEAVPLETVSRWPHVGVGNHAKVGDGVVAAGRSGIMNDIPSGMVVQVSCTDHARLRQMVALRQLPDLVKMSHDRKMLDGLNRRRNNAAYDIRSVFSGIGIHSERSQG